MIDYKTIKIVEWDRLACDYIVTAEVKISEEEVGNEKCLCIEKHDILKALNLI